MKRFFAIFLMLPLMAWAESIKFTTFYRPGGNGMAVSTMMAEELQRLGWDIAFRSTGNCALSRQIYQDSTEPMLAVWENELLATADHACALPVTKNEFMGAAYMSPEYLCSSKSITDLRAQEWTIGTRRDAVSAGLVAELRRAGLLLRAVQYENSGGVNNAMLAGEVDLALTTGGAGLARDGKVTCFYTTNDRPIQGARPITELAADFRRANRKVIIYYQAKNFSAQEQARLRKDIQRIVTGDRWQQFLTSKSLLGLPGPNDFGVLENSIKDLRP